jgi:hypothetical protein
MNRKIWDLTGLTSQVSTLVELDVGSEKILK